MRATSLSLMTALLTLTSAALRAEPMGCLIQPFQEAEVGTQVVGILHPVMVTRREFGILLGGLPSLGVPAMGLIVGIYALVFISSLAGQEFHAKSVFILATVLAIGSYVAFVWALKLQFPVWPSFITG